MLEWTTIIVTLIGSGGIVGLFLITERKTSASVENLRKQYDVLMDLFEKQQQRHDQDVAKLAELYDEKAALRERLDEANTRAAINALLRCDNMGCTHREPPLGSRLDTQEQSQTKQP